MAKEKKDPKQEKDESKKSASEAEDKAAAKDSKSPPPKANSSILANRILIKSMLTMIGIALLIASQYIFIFCIFAMLPSVTSLLIDRGGNRLASSTIAAFNMIAVMPFLDNIWNSNDYAYTAKSMISDVHVWFIIFGMTSVGWFIIVIIPQITGRLFVLRANNKIKKIEKQLSDLRDTWTYNL